MEFVHELVMAVINNASEAFDEAGLPPAAIADLKDTWLSKLDARGMFDAGPSPFPPVALAPKDLYKMRCVLKKKAPHHLSAREPSSAEPAPTAGGAMMVPAMSAWPAAGASASRDEDEESAEYGRPQRARAPPRSASLPLAASRAFEVVPAVPSLPASGSERPRDGQPARR